ncbi:rRNA maturation RNase YbeY [Acuticoccus sp.]|uniref:rRNA maturation RNase YbeY n=1 Tax=Acuticoccus sp. TaxID=1904378 RepID=UPI003B52B77B
MSEVVDEDVTAGPPSIEASVRIVDPRWTSLAPASIADVVLSAVARSDVASGTAGTLDILLADDPALAELNGRWRGRDGPTNVLAFPSGEACCADGTAFLGGIALSYDTAEREAGERGIPLTDHVTHLTLHGLLHLLGFDHVDEADREAMERVEVDLLSGLGIADPYLGS